MWPHKRWGIQWSPGLDLSGPKGQEEGASGKRALLSL